MSTLKVGGIRGLSASSDAITVANDGTASANLTTVNSVTMPNGGAFSNRNLLINGSFMINQRGLSSTSTGYQTADRWLHYSLNTGVTVTQSQQNLSSSDTPYSLGFRKFNRIALSGAGTANADAQVLMLQKIEAQDIANSGWNYTSTSSYVTLQFWFRCSTNQTFYCYLETKDGTSQSYPFSFTASGNDTWTKITKTIPGNSNLQFDNDNGEGLLFVVVPFYGVNLTDDSKSLNEWSAFNANRTPDYASTWFTAGASTFDITGVQLEVGQVATDYEHLRYADELRRCQRYFWNDPVQDVNFGYYACRYGNSGAFANIECPVTMRTTPTATGTRGDGGSWTSITCSPLRIQFYRSNDYTTYVTSATISASAEL